jgi:DNA-damage-inducible protein D
MSDFILFNGKKIRRILYEGEWFFSVVDVVGVLTESVNSRDYWYRLKVREKESSNVELSTFCRQLKLKSSDGKEYLTDCANKKGIFRIIQSIPSKKAEPFKLWLAKVGSDRIDEIENPELAQDRARNYYELKGYPKDWVDKRLRGIAIRQDLTREWNERDVKEDSEYAILTNEISRATFGVSMKDHKDLKKLNLKLINENLRDHMTDLELIFSMLGEKVTTEITKEEDLEGFNSCLGAGIRGGNVAGKARLDAEREIGKKIVSNKNASDIIEEKSKKESEVKEIKKR